jgi:hypothetical protein
MPYRRFLLWGAFEGLAWSTIVLLFGYAAGALSRIQTAFGTAAWSSVERPWRSWVLRSSVAGFGSILMARILS